MRRPRLISLLVFIFLIFLRIFVDSSEKLVNIVAMINGVAFAIVLFDVLDRLRVKIIQKIKCNTAAKTITQREVMLFTKKYYVFILIVIMPFLVFHALCWCSSISNDIMSITALAVSLLDDEIVTLGTSVYKG